MNKKICIITTGGTIGSTLAGGVISVDGKADKVALLYNGTASFSSDIFSPYNVLSENIQSEHMYQLVTAVRSLNLAEYAGIIITVGTDTLAYVSNYLSIALCGLGLPITLVSADYPIEDSRSNAKVNFTTAVDFLLSEPLANVYVVYQNVGENAKVHLGSRLTQARQLDGYFGSVCNRYVCICEDGQFNMRMAFNKKMQSRLVDYSIDGSLSGDVMYIRAYAFMNFDNYAVSENVRAVVVELYHSGTIDSDSFKKFSERMRGCAVKVILSSASIEDDIYESFVGLEDDSNVIVCRGTGIENVIIKAMLSVGQLNGKELVRFLTDTNFAYENIAE